MMTVNEDFYIPTKGGSYTSGGRKARSVKNFQKDIQLNEQLFELAESYL